MYQIDLLNGRSRPRKNSPLIVALICMLFVLPVIMPAVVYALNQQVSINNTAMYNAIDKLEGSIDLYTDSSELSEKINSKKLVLKKCAKEFSNELSTQYSFSEILEKLSVLLPQKLLITRIEVLSDVRTISRPDPEDADYSILVPAKKWVLVLEIKENGTASLDDSLKDYIRLIESDEKLKCIEKLEYKKFVEMDGFRKYVLECDLGLKIMEGQEHVKE